MIAKIAIPIIIAIVLGALYFDRYYCRKWQWWKRLLVWLLPLTSVAFTIWMARQPDYFPDDFRVQNAYLHVLCFYVVPIFLVAFCGTMGLLLKKRRKGEHIGWSIALLIVLVYAYGTFVGFNKLEVKHLVLTFDDLPEQFDGYRIVQFSDAHVGTLVGVRADILRRAVDSINALRADAVVFTGDLQNKQPSEVEPHLQLLGSIRARDGVFSVLGNHDYCVYIRDDDPFLHSAQMGRTVDVHQKMGWKLLTNSRQRLRRDSASLVIAGMENDGQGDRFPKLGNINSTLYGVSRDEFVVLLEHDPTAWRRLILPHCHAQLTLSGHTHGGQFELFGWSPASFIYREYEGLYRVGNRQLYVSRGIGGVVPFRFGAAGEIVEITLKRAK